MSRRLAAGLAGLAALTSWAVLAPAHADERDVVPEYVGWHADLVTSIAPSTPSWLTPDYPGEVVEVTPGIAGAYVGLLTRIAPSPPPWLTPDYPGQVADAAPAIVDGYVGAVAKEHYGTGAFTGSVTWDGPIPPTVEECRVDRAAVRGTVAITADVAFTAGTTTFTGPLVVTGTSCGSSRTWLLSSWAASGTDSSGNTFRCPRLEGLARWVDHWYANVVGRDCTVNGVVLPRVQLLLVGGHAPVGPTTGSMAGALTVNTY